MRLRESGRYEIRHVPASIRERDRIIGETRTPTLKKYERICFEKQLIHLHGKPMADLVHPKHPLMHAVTDLILEAHRHKLKQGAVLVDPNDDGLTPRVLFMLSHTIREGDEKTHRVTSRRLQFVTIDQHGQAANAGWAAASNRLVSLACHSASGEPRVPTRNGNVRACGGALARPMPWSAAPGWPEGEGGAAGIVVSYYPPTVK
jgi:hypothetical protein